MIPFADNNIAVISMSGTPRQMGAAYGTGAAALIHRTRDHYFKEIFPSFGVEPSLLRKQADEISMWTQRFAPEIAEEIVATAEAAGLTAWELFALNGRTEILASIGQAAPECSTVAFPDHHLLGQNWDWTRTSGDTLVVLRIEGTANTPDKLVLTEAGIVGKIGLNAAGLGVCLNILKGDARDIGVPIHVLCRTLLNCRTVQEADRMLRSAGRTSSSCLTVCDSAGSATAFELHGTSVHSARSQSNTLIHTNHYVTPELQHIPAVFATSVARYEHAQKMAQNLSHPSIKELKTLLLDRDEMGDACLNAPWHASDFISGQETGTCATVAMDLTARTILLGRPNTGEPFQTLTILPGKETST